MSARLSRYDFTYSAPSASFDRSLVSGSVLSNLTVLSESDCRAVETSAAGRLGNVIVDSEQTGRQLLEAGQLKQRVTLIPLNRISQQSSIPAAVAERACSLVGRDSARVAVACVSFERKVEAAMQFVFGSTFVCPDVQTASQLAFDPSIARRSVTQDGDVVDPHGTMEGGTAAQQQAGLSPVQLQLKRSSTSQRIGELQAEQAELQHRLLAEETAARRVATLQSELEAAEHALSMLRVELEQSVHSACEAHIAEWSEQLGRCQIEAETGEAEQQRLSAQCASLEREIAECETELGRKAASAALQRRIASLQVDIAAAGAQVSGAQQQQMAATAQLSQLQDDIGQAEGEAKAGRQHLAQLDAQMQSEQRRLEDSSATYEAAKARLAAGQQALQQRSRHLQQAQRTKQRLTAQRKECELELRRLTAAGSKLESELADARRRLDRLLKENGWIAAQRHTFGQAGGDFDFGPFTAAAASLGSSTPYGRLQEEVAALSKESEQEGRQSSGQGGE